MQWHLRISTLSLELFMQWQTTHAAEVMVQMAGIQFLISPEYFRVQSVNISAKCNFRYILTYYHILFSKI